MSYLFQRKHVWVIIALITVYIATQTFTASSHTRQDNSDHQGSGEFTGETWPPQPENISNIALEPRSPLARAVEEAQNDITNAVFNDNAVSQQLGERYIHTNTTSISEKWQTDMTNNYEVTFFSYSNNQTVIARVEDNVITNVNILPAEAFQPPVRQAESEEAIDIARDFWIAQSEDRVNQLEGFTILAHPPSETESFYDSRVVYVSFHVNSTTAPELLAWVDMNTQTVINSFTEGS